MLIFALLVSEFGKNTEN